MKQNALKTALLLILLTAGSSLAGQETLTSGISLADCIRMGMANNLSLRQAELEVVKEQYRLKEMIGAGLPQITGSASFDNYTDIPVTMVSGEIIGQPGVMVPIKLGTTYNAEAGMTIGQMIYSPSYFASVKLFRKACEISELGVKKGREELAYNIAALYLFIQLSEKQLALLDSNIVAIEAIRGYTDQSYRRGIVCRQDLDRVVLLHNGMINEKESLSLERGKQLEMLRYLTGYDDSMELTLSDDIEELLPVILPFDSVGGMQTELAIMTHRVELSELNRKMVASALLPSLTAYASCRYQAPVENTGAFGDKDNWYRMSVVGIKLTIPILAGGTVRNSIRQSRVESEQADIGRQDLTATIMMQYRNAKQQYDTYTRLENAMKENMVLSSGIFRRVNDQYIQGLNTLTDVLNARAEYNTAQMAWLNALLRKRLAGLEVMKITGTINILINQ